MTITFFRFQRSTYTPAIDPKSRRGSSSAATITALAIVEPVSW